MDELDERLLYYIWQHQHFEREFLQTTHQEKLMVFSQGFLNENAGPDFREARIKINELEWVGNVEIHVKSSDWYLHQHELNPDYQQVILHVVWDANKEILLNDGRMLPTLELKNIVSPDLLHHYRRLVNSPEQLPCASFLPHVDKITLLNQLDVMVAERLMDKSASCLVTYEKNGENWEETAYITLCKAFGMKVNQEPFEMLARSLPYKIIQKNVHNPKTVLALLFGQAGFLEEKPADDYHAALQKEYAHIIAKYSLKPVLSRFHWKFSKLRPANFPTVRVAQLAAFLTKMDSLWTWIEAGHEKQKSIYTLQLPEYWLDHYDFGKKLATGKNRLGDTMFSHLLINVVAPVRFARAISENNQIQREEAFEVVVQLKPERNKITGIFAELGFPLANAADSQAVLHLHKNYCTKRRCLSCQIGAGLLKRKMA